MDRGEHLYKSIEVSFRYYDANIGFLPKKCDKIHFALYLMNTFDFIGCFIAESRKYIVF